MTRRRNVDRNGTQTRVVAPSREVNAYLRGDEGVGIHPFVDRGDQRLWEHGLLWDAALARIERHGGDGDVVVVTIP